MSNSTNTLWKRASSTPMLVLGRHFLDEIPHLAFQIDIADYPSTLNATARAEGCCERETSPLHRPTRSFLTMF